MKLYEITNSINQVKKFIDDPEELETYLDTLNIELENKAKNIFMLMKNIEAPIQAIDDEIERLTKMKKSYQAKTNNLKNYISYTMQKNGIEKIESDIVKFSFRKSETIEIIDESMIPSEFINIKEVKTVDKIAIKKAIKAGNNVRGVECLVHKNLQIK
ncbi:MAG: siphovirus Gp157 family protein [Bacteroidia bacterium]|nr:siphovirus Gp157 family protein [Bacteroidia bacterium]